MAGPFEESVQLLLDEQFQRLTRASRRVHEALTRPVEEGGLVPKDTGELVESITANGSRDIGEVLLASKETGDAIEWDAGADHYQYVKDPGKSQQNPVGLEISAEQLTESAVRDAFD